MKHIPLTLLLLLTTGSAIAIESDTVFVGDKIEYKVDGASEGSEIIWKVNGADIVAKSGNSITLKFNKEGEYSLMVCEKNSAQCIGEFSCIDIFAKSRPGVTPEEPEPDIPETEEPQPEEPEPNEQQPEEVIIYFPNIFTPNSDGLNDIYHISYNIKPENFRIEIFSRGGKKVFSSGNPDFRWEGSDCNPGTYFYICQYISNGKSTCKNGTINIERGK